MTLNNNTRITMNNRDGSLVVISAKYGVATVEKSQKEYNSLFDIYAEMRKVAPLDRHSYFMSNPNLKKVLDELLESLCNKKVEDTPPSVEKVAIAPDKLVQDGLSGLLNFFKEFEFEPNFRFVNSFAMALQQSESLAKTYVMNYFKLVDSIYLKEVTAKMKSPEWSDICKKVSAVAPKSIINNRFKIYYGSAGTGKTTLAQQETAGRCVICNNSMLPADLMEDFIFVNGQPSFRPSMLWECMEKGLPITLDEINLLPFEALRFLQGILDGKKEFTYKGNLIHIADGFQVIGTMNLIVNGAVFNLPEPLVDRASEMKEFKLTAKQLLSAIL